MRKTSAVCVAKLYAPRINVRGLVIFAARFGQSARCALAHAALAEAHVRGLLAHVAGRPGTTSHRHSSWTRHVVQTTCYLLHTSHDMHCWYSALVHMALHSSHCIHHFIYRATCIPLRASCHTFLQLSTHIWPWPIDLGSVIQACIAASDLMPNHPSDVVSDHAAAMS